MTDLEELKRRLAESGGELLVLLAEMAHTDDGDVHGACLFGLAAVNALPDLIARVEKAAAEDREERAIRYAALAWEAAYNIAQALDDMLYTHPASSRRRGGEGSMVRLAQEDQERAIAKAKAVLGRVSGEAGFISAASRAKAEG